MGRKLLFSHPIGSPFAAAAIRALNSAELLETVVTSYSYEPNSFLAKLFATLPTGVGRRCEEKWQRRRWLPVGEYERLSFPQRECCRMALELSGIRTALGISGQRLVDWVYRGVDAAVAKGVLSPARHSAVYAYEDGALESFIAARQHGVRRIYDLPIAYYDTAHEIAVEEARRFPELASSLGSTREPDVKVERKRQELALADHVIVASSFTKESLLRTGFDSHRIAVIPYGAPAASARPRVAPKEFKVGFVGRVGPRKGVHYLLQAWKEVHGEGSELVLIGVDEFPRGWLNCSDSKFRYIPSVAHSKIRELLSGMSVLVLPSLIEGFGMVLLEAMAAGVPVIATPNTAAPDLIEEGVQGFIVPIRDSRAIAERLVWCLEHPAELEAMSLAAWKRASELPWSIYEKALSERVRSWLR